MKQREDIVTFLVRHLTPGQDSSGRVILMAGPWGCGKTFLWRTDVVPKLPNPPVTVSLFGVDSLIRPGQPDTLDDARALVARWVGHYNTVRLHSAIGYITPADFLAARGPIIWAERDTKLEAAREARRVRRAELHQGAA